MLKKILVSPWTALITLAVIIYVTMQQPVFQESIKLRYFDTLITSAPEQTTTISTVNIDESALEQYGQWPFSRDVYADIIKDLYDRGAGLVVFNVLMPEVDRGGKDAVLAEAMKEYPVVLPNFGSDTTKNTPRNPGAVMIGDPSGKVVEYDGIVASIESIESSAYGTGISSTFPEVDGVTRRMPMVVKSGDTLYPSMGLEVLRILAGDPSFQIKFSEIGIDKLRVPQFGIISTDPVGRVWIDYQQRSQSYSLTELPENFDSGIVIVGTSAAGIANPIATSRGELWPQEMQASVIATLASGTNIQRPDWAPGAELLALVALTVLLLFLTRWVYVGLGVGIVALAAIVPATTWLYSKYLYLFDGTLLLGGLTLILLHAYGVKFVSEFLQKQAIKKQFAGYCSPTVVKMLQENPDLIKKGVKKDVSVMFSDLRGFTPIGEHYGDDVKGLGDYMNGYMDAITKPILDHDGMVVKYVGDASMHIQGAPIDDDNHAFNIVETGLQMLDAVDAYTQEAEAKGLPPAAMGFGVNSGDGFIGEMGSTQRHSYDILGDMVSTAARLEARCKAYGVLCIIGNETYKRTSDKFFYLFLDNLQPKGKSTPDFIWTALRTKGDYSKDKDKHDKMHELYKAQKFTQAAIMCENLKGSFDGQMDKYYDIWIERCSLMKTQKLPKSWNGAFVATEK